jgi:iron only hydrogenase large subunit-like protein
MATIAKFIKDEDKTAKVVFIGPCTSKKAEAQKDTVKDFVDAVITFEELQALFDSRDIDITSLEESELHDASYYGRIFARCGGLADAVKQGLKEEGLENFELSPCTCDGIEECRTALLKKSKGVLNANFIEGMACVDGCIGGAGNLTHNLKNKIDILKDATQAYKTIEEAIEKI